MTLSNQNPLVQESLLNDSDIMLSITDRQGKIISANSIFCNVSGYHRQALTGQPQNIVRHKDMPRHIFQIMWDNIKTNQPFCGYLKNETKNKEPYWIFTLVFPVSSQYFAISMKAQSPLIHNIKQLYEDMLKTEKTSLTEGHQLLNLFVLSQGFNDYQSWMVSALEAEMKTHPFFSSILLENEAVLEVNPTVSTTLHAISNQALGQMWDSYVEFQKNFKNCILRLRDCLQGIHRFQSLMMTMNHIESTESKKMTPYSKEFTSLSIHRMHLDFFFRSAHKLQFWYNSLILQSKLIDDIIMDSMKTLAHDNSSQFQIDQMYDTLTLINVITENIYQLPGSLEGEYERLYQKIEAYLKLLDIENKDPAIENPSYQLKKELIGELKDSSKQLTTTYSELCNDLQVDISDFHQIVRSAFHIMIGPKRASH